LYQRDHVNGLLIKVQEGRSNTFDGVLGYIPAKNEGETGFLTGLVSVTMRNLFGTGRKFGFHWQREDQNTQELGVQYLEPWIFGFPLNVGLGFFQRQQDTSYVRRTLNLKNELMLTERLSISLLLESDDVIPSAEISTTRVLNTSIRTIGAELSYDTRNDFISPTSGARYRTDYQYGTQKTRDIPPTLAGSIKDDVHVHKLGIDLDFYLSTFSRQVIAAGLHGRQIQSSQIDEGQMYRFGGANTLRGYRENQFIGSLVGWTNTEYRFLLARRSFLYGFVDTGYYFRQSDDVRQIPSSEDFKLGYGVGLQVETAIGHLGVSFALGEGDSFSTAKVHFGLVNEF
jgi:outer membrane protein insertion porin family